MTYFIAAIVFLAIIIVFSGVKAVPQGREWTVERFGRFPHRNALLGRLSSAEELEFLQQPGSSF